MASEMQVVPSSALMAWLFRKRTNSRRRLRHPKVPAGWNVAARRSVTRRCYTTVSWAVRWFDLAAASNRSTFNASDRSRDALDGAQPAIC